MRCSAFWRPAVVECACMYGAGARKVCCLKATSNTLSVYLTAAGRTQCQSVGVSGIVAFFKQTTATVHSIGRQLI